MLSGLHRVALDGLFDRINLDPKIQIKYVDPRHHFADMLTKRGFTYDEWNHHLKIEFSHCANLELTILDKGFPEFAKEVGNMKAAIHLGPNYNDNPKVYKNTNYVEIQSLFDVTPWLIS